MRGLDYEFVRVTYIVTRVDGTRRVFRDSFPGDWKRREMQRFLACSWDLPLSRIRITDVIR